MSDQSIKRASLAEIGRMRDSGDLHYDPQAPSEPGLGADFWAHAVVVPPRGAPPKSVHLKLEPDVFDVFNSQD